MGSSNHIQEFCPYLSDQLNYSSLISKVGPYFYSIDHGGRIVIARCFYLRPLPPRLETKRSYEKRRSSPTLYQQLLGMPSSSAININLRRKLGYRCIGSTSQLRQTVRAQWSHRVPSVNPEISQLSAPCNLRLLMPFGLAFYLRNANFPQPAALTLGSTSMVKSRPSD